MNVLFRYPRATATCLALQVLVCAMWAEAVLSLDGSLTATARWGIAGGIVWLISSGWAACLELRCRYEEYHEGRGR